MKKILVIGSINMDIVSTAPRIPVPGETIIGHNWSMIPGGKGANQAVAAALAGGNVRMIGKTGADDFGIALRRSLGQSGVRTEMLKEEAGTPTGVALISVDDAGANSIIVIPGANHRLTPGDLDGFEDAFRHAPIILLQLEIPWPTVAHAIRLARRYHCRIVLDPAPVPREIPAPDWLEGLDIITPNQVEAEMLTGVKVDSLASAQRAAEILHQRGAASSIVKLGSEGVLVYHGQCFTHIPGHRVKTVDTTAAGDTFAGALGVALGEDLPLTEAVRFANAAGALATTRFGAQSSAPTRREIERFLSVASR